MSIDDARLSLSPLPPPPRPPRAQSSAALPAFGVGEWPDPLDFGPDATAWRAARAERIATQIKVDIGTKPDPDAKPPVEGTGLRGEIAALRGDVRRLTEVVTESEAAAERRSRFAIWAATVFGGALLVLLAGAVWRLGARVRFVDGGEPAAQHVERAAQLQPLTR